MPASTDRSHILALDGVRGTALLLVLASHFCLWGTTAVDRMSDNVTQLGFSGVDLFFVLSGFLITRLLWPVRETVGNLGRFWVRRILRIWPLYVATLVAFFVLLPAVKGWRAYPMPDLWAARWYYWLHATNIKEALQGSTAMPYNTGHFWSLAVEEQFYLLWPLIVWRTRSLRGLVRVCGWVIAGAWILRLLIGGVLNEQAAAYTLMPARMDGLALGAAIFALQELGALDRWRQSALVVALLTAIIGVVLMFDRGVSAWIGVSIGLCATLFHASIMVRVLTGSGAVVDRPFLRMFGRYSYGMYVIHYPLLLMLAPFAGWTHRLPSIAGWSLPSVAVFFTGATALSLALAIASYHVLEQPFLHLKDRLAPRATAVRAATTTDAASQATSS